MKTVRTKIDNNLLVVFSSQLDSVSKLTEKIKFIAVVNLRWFDIGLKWIKGMFSKTVTVYLWSVSHKICVFICIFEVFGVFGVLVCYAFLWILRSYTQIRIWNLCNSDPIMMQSSSRSIDSTCPNYLTTKLFNKW